MKYFRSFHSGITDVVSYDACGGCKSKVQDDTFEKCTKCGYNVAEVSFFFTIMIMNKEEDISR